MIRKPTRDDRYSDSYASYENQPESEYGDPQAIESPGTAEYSRSRSGDSTAGYAGGRGPSVIDASSSFDGKFESGGDLVVFGSISGEIICRGQFTVEKDATAKAKINTHDAVVNGRVEGDIVCSGRAHLSATATVSGTLKAAALVVEEGATIHGNVETSSVAAASAEVATPRSAGRKAAADDAAATVGGPAAAAATTTAASGAQPSRWSARNREVPSFALVSADEQQRASGGH